MTHFGFPFRVDGRGRTADADGDTHIKQLIEQLLFTAPGERVNRPAFGTAIRQMVFSPLSDESAAALQFMLQGALQQWLGDTIQITGVVVRSVDASLQVTVQYIVRRNQQPRVARFTREV
ncbi:MAG TPA: GPW/gp25 family protein [Polyangium sp.]|nr:GPW/gp25 family protein [Polyangium sp.]